MSKLSTFSVCIGALAGRIAKDWEADRLKGALAQALAGVTLAAGLSAAPQQALAQQQQQHGAGQQIMPQQSAVRWSQMLGQVMGAAAGSAMAQSVGHPGVAQVIIGASAEAGRNAGAMVAQGVYGQGQAAGGAVAGRAVPLQKRDQLDQAGLHAALSYEKLLQHEEGVRSGRFTQHQALQARALYSRAAHVFIEQVRVARFSGMDVSPWDPLQKELRQHQPSPDRLASLAVPMLERLHRPGGPGYVDTDDMPEGSISLSQLRQQAEASRQQARQMAEAPVWR